MSYDGQVGVNTLGQFLTQFDAQLVPLNLIPVVSHFFKL
jgi:hypothetical protein